MSNPPPSYPPPGGYQGGGYPPPPTDPSGGKTQTLGMNYNTGALLCYLPTCLCCIGLIFSLIFYFTEPKESRFMRFHAFQGMLFAISWIVIGIVLWIIRLIVGVGGAVGSSAMGGGGGGDMMGLGAGIVGLLLFFVQLAISLGLLIISIVAMVKASKGEMWKMPIIGNMAEKNS